MPKYNHIEVRAGKDQHTLETKGYDVADQVDTIAKAKARAKHYITAEYQVGSECSYPLMYAQVIADGEVLYDFFHKDHPKGN